MVDPEQEEARKFMKEKNRSQKARMAVEVCEQLPPTMKKAMGLAQEKGTSGWLTVLPFEEHGFALHKGAFRDAMALRYGCDHTACRLYASVGSRMTSAMH